MMPRSSRPPLNADAAPHASEAAPSQGSGFLLRHGARLLHPASGPGLRPGALAQESAPLEPAPPALQGHTARRLEWEEERALSDWNPLDVGPNVRGAGSGFDWREGPLSFAASCDVGREVAWLRDGQGEDVPLRLSQVGALSLQASITSRSDHGLQPAWASLERVVALAADRFEWDEIEEWSAQLASQGFRLLIVPDSLAPNAQHAGRKLAEAASQARARTTEEALRLERQAIRSALLDSPGRAGQPRRPTHTASTPVIVRGSLALRRGAFEPLQAVVAVCSPSPILPPIILPEWPPAALDFSQPEPILSAVEDEHASIPRAVWHTIYALKPGQRTPTWRCDEAACSLACWFVRLNAPSSGGSPLSGLVHVEVRRELWEAQGSGREQFVAGLSSLLLDVRARGQGRLWPTESASRQMRALLTPHRALEAHFARVCGL